MTWMSDEQNSSATKKRRRPSWLAPLMPRLATAGVRESRRRMNRPPGSPRQTHPALNSRVYAPTLVGLARPPTVHTDPPRSLRRARAYPRPYPRAHVQLVEPSVPPNALAAPPYPPWLVSSCPAPLVPPIPKGLATAPRTPRTLVQEIRCVGDVLDRVHAISAPPQDPPVVCGHARSAPCGPSPERVQPSRSVIPLGI